MLLVFERMPGALAAHRPMGGDSVPGRLSAEIEERLAALLEPGTEAAFVNFPHIDNVGDSAIWLGTRRALRRAGVRVRYQCDPAGYRRGLLARSVGERGTILIQGGGNLGDVYPNQHRVRERVLRDFPGARVIQLPQTAWFRSRRGRERFRGLAEAHSDFTLMLRERASLEWARESLDVPAVLCPDLALALPPLRRREPELDVLWLMRGDRESLGRPLPPLGPREELADWRSGGPMRRSGPRDLRLLLAAYDRLGAAIAADGRLASVCWRASAATFRPIAERRLDLGTRLVSRGRVVVTDRLHGHVISLLAGIPHVLLDNANGKCRAFWESWTRASPLVNWAEGPAEAIEIARARLAETAPGAQGRAPTS
jgi:exopolysaccharide biosynthesis predicted pyruvyltransferase EpsI